VLFNPDDPLPPFVKALCVLLGIYAAIGALVLLITSIG